MDFVVSKWHINRLSGNHKQADYKKTTEYLDSHAVNTIDLVLTDNLVHTLFGGGQTNELSFTYEDALKLNPLLQKCVLYKQCYIAKSDEDGSEIAYCESSPMYYGIAPYEDYATIKYILGGETYNIEWNSRNMNLYTHINDYYFYVSKMCKLIAIGTGDLEIVIDDVEEMPA